MSNSSTEPKILPWPELQKKAEREGVDIMDYVSSMNAHILNQRDEITRLREQLRTLRWRADRAEDFLNGYGSAPGTAKEVLRGSYDHEMRPT